MRWCLVLVLLGLGCRGDGPPPAEQRSLEGLVARVGSEAITPETVGRIAAAQQVALPEARDRAVFDALAAEAASADLGPRAVRSAENRALAWALLRRLWADVRSAPLTESELVAATKRHWRTYDRPRAYRTIHAITQVEGEVTREQAREAAERIREGVEHAAEVARDGPEPEIAVEDLFAGTDEARRDPARAPFEQAAREAAEDVPLQVQVLPPVAADGTALVNGMAPENRAYDPEYAAAAADLEKRGDLSEVVETRHGFHVIMLLGIVPERRASAAVRRSELRREILRRRGGEAQKRLLERSSAERGVDIERNHAALLELVRPAGRPEGEGT